MGTDHPKEARGIILIPGEIGAVLNDEAVQSLGSRIAGAAIQDIGRE